MKASKKKYTLYSANDDRPNSVKPCAFFFSDAGCRNGDGCTFSHSDVPDNASVSSMSTAPEIQSSKPQRSSSIISTGSLANPKKAKKEKKEKKRKQVDSGDNGSVGDQGGTANQIKLMEERMQQMEQELAAAKANSNSSNSHGAVTSSNKSAKKEKHQTPGGAKSTPFVGVPLPSSGINMSMSVQSMGGQSVGGTNALRPKSNFLSPTLMMGGAAGAGIPSTNNMMSVSTSTKKAKRREEDEDTAFLFGAVNSVINPALSAGGGMGGELPSFQVNKNLGATAFVDGGLHEVAAERKSSSKKKSVSSSSSSGNGACDAGRVEEALGFGDMESFLFLEKESVMKTLETSGTAHATGKAQGASAKVQKMLDKMASADPNQLPWGTLLQKTQQAPRFKKDYNFERADQTWVSPRAFGEWSANLPPVIAIDCEMCQTTDPLTRERDNNALIRFSVVNGLDPTEVLIDQLVKPAFPISDSRAHIHGIPQEKLDGVSFTLRHAQAALLQLCSDHTIIVGHSVHNDLKALHTVHHNCIDTSYLFAVENEPGASPSMRDVSEHILGTKLPDLHDSVLDARASNQAAMYLLVQGCPEVPPACPRTGSTASSNLAAQLLAHRLPAGCTADNLLAMVMKYTRVIPESVGAVTGIGEGDDQAKGKSIITFTSKAHADLVFDSVPGPNRPDKSNKAQKRIYLKGDAGGYINLRKQV